MNLVLMDYDYIIIGAGSAGCILANRLSENPENQVLLIEAGGPDTKLEVHIPAAYSKLNRTAVDWAYWTEPQAHVLGRKMFQPRGKTLGGSSSTNAMAYIRGNAADYDEWAALGNTGWSYADMLPYFKKSEANQQFQDAFHGNDGLLNVTKATAFRTPLADAFVEACVAAGIPANDDFNGATQSGAGLFQFTIKNGKRHSAATAFLKPVLARKNLRVLTRTHTKRILIENDRATGVEVITGKNTTQTLKASREVILSAGAFNSPQLLLLSGVGSPDHLAAYKIPLKKELIGVGQNLQDHVFAATSFLSTQPVGTNHHLRPLNQVKALFQYLINKKGPLTISPLEANAFLKVGDSPDPVDMQFHFSPIQVGADYSADLYDISTFPYEDGCTILPTLLKPKSVGFVGLRSGNPMDAPVIQPNYFAEEADRTTMIRGTRKALEVLETGVFAPFRKAITLPPDSSSDEAILLHIQKIMETVYHPVGTCKMGQDEAAVVDTSLRVHGIEALRVVDASIMPRIVSGNTNAPTYAIAEKAAEMILKG